MNLLFCSGETWDLEKCEMGNEKLVKWCSVHANFSRYCVYLLSYFRR